jgi:hypothetical protein
MMKKKLLLGMSSLLLVFLMVGRASAQSDVSTQIIRQIETNPSPRESLVQWYYSMDGFYAKIASLS